MKWAVAYGADAVYFGTEFGSLRSFAGNFTLDEANDGLNYLHKHGKLGYAALNIYPFSDEYQKIIDTAKALDAMGVDAVIVSDLGVLAELKKLDLKTVLHISTQANTTSYQTVLAYRQLGAKRVNIARELSLEQVKAIRKKVKGQIEIEIFIHGSVCFSYSGRCAVSDYMTGFRANHGQCKHPCRWKYALVEEKRPDQYFPVAEDDRGLYFFNSKELALFEFVPQLADAGIESLKIEGRNKSIHYIATVVSFYRQILDGKKFTTQRAFELLNRVPNRGYSSGFMKGAITADDYQISQSASHSDSVFVGNIIEEKKDGCCILEVRNKIHAAEQLEVLKTDGSLSKITLPTPLTTTNNQSIDFANNSQFILLQDDLPPYTILRRVDS